MSELLPRPTSIPCTCGHSFARHTIQQNADETRPGCEDCFCSQFRLKHPKNCGCAICVWGRQQGVAS